LNLEVGRDYIWNIIKNTENLNAKTRSIIATFPVLAKTRNTQPRRIKFSDSKIK